MSTLWRHWVKWNLILKFSNDNDVNTSPECVQSSRYEFIWINKTPRWVFSPLRVSTEGTASFLSICPSVPPVGFQTFLPIPFIIFNWNLVHSFIMSFKISLSFRAFRQFSSYALFRLQKYHILYKGQSWAVLTPPHCFTPIGWTAGLTPPHKIMCCHCMKHHRSVGLWPDC